LPPLSLLFMRYFFVALLITHSNFFCLADSYSVFQEDGKVGLKNVQGEVLIPAEYEMLGWSEGDITVVDRVIGYRKNDLWGLITVSNQQITAAEYYSLAPGGGSWIIASKRSPLTLRISYGLLDTSGKTTIPFKYSGIKLHSMRAIVYTLDGNQIKYGLIDLSNKMILPQVYQNIYPVGSLRYAVQNFENKTALVTENGKPVTAFVIDSISMMEQGYAIIYQEGKQGLISREGNIIHQPIYRDIRFTSGKVTARLPNEWRVLDDRNTVQQSFQVDSLIAIAPHRYKLITETGTQLVDESFALVSPVKVQHIGTFYGDLAVFTDNGKSGVIRSDGKPVLPAQYDYIRIHDAGIIVCEKQGSQQQCFLYDRTGKRMTAKAYDAIRPGSEDLFIVSRNGFHGGVTRQGDEIVACAYDSLIDFKDNLIGVKFKGKYGIITRNEFWKVTPQNNRIQLINAERYFEYTDNQTILKSMDGIVHYFTTNELKLSGSNLIENVAHGGVWTINLNGQIIHREYPAAQAADKIFPSSEGYRMIIRNNRAGFIDELGRLRIANRYEDAQPFREGLAAVRILGKWGFINKEDKVVINPTFDEVTQFRNGLCIVKQAGKYGMIDPTGLRILECRYDELEILGSNRVLITQNGKGLADIQGNILLQARFESITDLNNGCVLVKQQGKYGLMTINGADIIPSIYELLVFEPEGNRYLGLVSRPYQELKRN
jgi:hypothetical protein